MTLTSNVGPSTANPGWTPSPANMIVSDTGAPSSIKTIAVGDTGPRPGKPGKVWGGRFGPGLGLEAHRPTFLALLAMRAWRN